MAGFAERRVLKFDSSSIPHNKNIEFMKHHSYPQDKLVKDGFIKFGKTSERGFGHLRSLYSSRIFIFLQRRLINA